MKEQILLVRQYANLSNDRSKRSIDIANGLGTDLLVLWLAREGFYIREAKDSQTATERKQQNT